MNNPARDLGAGNQILIIVERVNVDKISLPTPGVYSSSRAGHYQLNSTDPVKYRPAYIERISPDKSE